MKAALTPWGSWVGGRGGERIYFTDSAARSVGAACVTVTCRPTECLCVTTDYGAAERWP